MLAGDEPVEDYIIDLYSADAEQDRIPQRRLFKTDILLRQMSSVRCPVWGIWGSNDALHRGCMESILAGLSKAPLFQALTLVPLAGHWVQFEASQCFNRTLCAALDAIIIDL
jgi:pimeloyl-ACP methyl ester carboxylesterase